MQINPRLAFSDLLSGDVLEIGPGNSPFPTAFGSNTKFADRSVLGGRDVNWPELMGSISGPKADFDINIDADGLSGIPNDSFDAVIAAHVIEHLANPIRAIQEMQRVLRPGGKLVLIVPERTLTFDSVRAATPFSHVFQEFLSGVSDVSQEHIQEFCASVWSQPSFHPDLVREWHDPQKLNAERVALHRRRSIHVHCWSAEEFASFIAASIAEGLMSWVLESIYFAEENRGSIEFGILFTNPKDEPGKYPNLCSKFIEDWTNFARQKKGHGLRHIFKFDEALIRDISKDSDFDNEFLPSQLLGRQFDSMEKRILAIERSRSWRITAPLRQASTAVQKLCNQIHHPST